MLQSGAAVCNTVEVTPHAGCNSQGPHQKLILAHRIMIDRYIVIIQRQRPLDVKFLLDFCAEALKLENSDKLSRWVGFVQGMLYSKGMISLREERDFSRGLYRPLYEEMGLDYTTVEVN
jgi:hypothetical protein